MKNLNLNNFKTPDYFEYRDTVQPSWSLNDLSNNKNPYEFKIIPKDTIIDFGTVTEGEYSPPQIIYIQNIGYNDIDTLSIKNTGPFMVHIDNSLYLKPNDIKSIKVVYTPEYESANNLDIQKGTLYISAYNTISDAYIELKGQVKKLDTNAGEIEGLENQIKKLEIQNKKLTDELNNINITITSDVIDCKSEMDND